MAVKIGIAGIPLSSKGSDTSFGIKRLKELNLDIMELQFSRNIYLNVDSAKNVASLSRSLGVDLTCHASYFINLASLKKEVQSASIGRVADTLRIADILGCRLIVVHAGYYSGRSPDEAFGLIKENIDKVGEMCSSKALIGIETMGKQKSFGTVDEVIGLCQSCENVCPVIDFGHIHALTSGGLKMEKDFTDIFCRFEKEAGLKQFHVHMSCMEYSGGNEKRHMPLDIYDPDFRLMAKSIVENGFDCSVVCESPRLENDALLFKSWLEG